MELTRTEITILFKKTWLSKKNWKFTKGYENQFVYNFPVAIWLLNEPQLDCRGAAIRFQFM